MPDDVSVGRQFAAVRLARKLRQEDVARRAGCSRDAVSRLERGMVEGVTVASLRAMSRALGMPPLATLGWRGPEVDRLLDQAHASLVEAVVKLLTARGWEVATEFSFNHYGERGSVDVLAWHPATATLLIVEVKTRLWDMQDLLFSLDRKARLVPGLAARDRGWSAGAVGVLLVMPETRSHRASIDRQRATFAAALPQRQVEVKRWLADPRRSIRGILFLNNAHPKCAGQRSRSGRAPKRSRKPAESPPAGPNGVVPGVAAPQ